MFERLLLNFQTLITIIRNFHIKSRNILLINLLHINIIINIIKSRLIITTSKFDSKWHNTAIFQKYRNWVMIDFSNDFGSTLIFLAAIPAVPIAAFW